MKNNRIFLLKIFILVCLLIIIDCFVGMAFYRVLEIQSDGRYFKTNYVIAKSDEDIVIIGSSRAETNYIPGIITQNTNLSCWNAGRGGQGLPYMWAIEQEILRRYSPKILLFNIDNDLLAGPIDYDKAAFLRPFAKKHKQIYSILQKKDRFEKFRLSSNLYRNNSILFYLFRPFILKNKDGNPRDNGWKPRIGKNVTFSNEIPEKIEFVSGKYGLNSEKKDMFNKIVQHAVKKNIKVFLVFSPDFYPPPEASPTMKYIKKKYCTNKIRILDYTRDRTFVRNAEFFYDLNHMNVNGADAFTKKLTIDMHVEKTTM